MEKTKAIILANLDKHSHFNEYFKIVDIIETNEELNPDICIESCKALVEGISKTILIQLDVTKTVENIDDDDLPKVFKNAIRVLSENCEDIEGDFVSRFSAIIQVLGEIRNKRGDISHGRMAPKFIFSSKKIATTVKQMTDSMLEYILEHYFSIDFSVSTLNYEDDTMLEYNTWLDEGLEFPIKKAKYSKLLFENDYDEYESRYYDEFIKSKEEEVVEEIASDQEKIDESIESILEMEIESTEVVENEDIEEFSSFDDDEETQVSTENKTPTKQLVNKFDEETFWNEKKHESIQRFAHENDLNREGLEELIENYLFSEMDPLRDEVVAIMNVKPKLHERQQVTKELVGRIIELANKLKEGK